MSELESFNLANIRLSKPLLPYEWSRESCSRKGQAWDVSLEINFLSPRGSVCEDNRGEAKPEPRMSTFLPTLRAVRATRHGRDSIGEVRARSDPSDDAGEHRSEELAALGERRSPPEITAMLKETKREAAGSET
jgi:hypothetical protein